MASPSPSHPLPTGGDTLRLDLLAADDLVAALRRAADEVAVDRSALAPLLADAGRLLADPREAPVGRLATAGLRLAWLAEDLARRVGRLGGVGGRLAVVDDLTVRIGGWSGPRDDARVAELAARRREHLLRLVGSAALVPRVVRVIESGASTAEALQHVAREVEGERRSARAAAVAADLGISAAAAAAVIDRIDRALGELTAAGYPKDVAVTAVALAEEHDLDLAEARETAEAEGHDLIDHLGRILLARGLGLGLSELEALEGLERHFPTYDHPRGDAPDGRVADGDLRYVVDHPDRFTPAQVAGARLLLEHGELWHRLDTAHENRTVLAGDGFGRREPGDGIVSALDLEAFVVKAQLHHLLRDHAAAIDVAADATDRVDGVVAADDLRRYLHGHPELPADVVAGIETMLAEGWFHRSWWDEHRDEVAAGAAIVGGGLLVVASGGSAGVVAIVLTSAGAAAGATVAVNVATGEAPLDGVARNAVVGSVIGLGLHGVAAGAAEYGAATTTLGRSAAAARGVSEAATVVEWGGIDVVLPEEWEAEVHEQSGLVGMMAGGYAGAVDVEPRDVSVLAAGAARSSPAG